MDLLIVFLVCFLPGATAGQQEVAVKPDHNAVLQCQSPKSETIQVLKWSRPDMRSDGYVYFYRNKRSYENYQLPCFHGRVALRDPEMKNGDASLILKNVTANDAGTYDCYVSVGDMKGSKSTHSEIRHLTITDSGQTPESTWWRQTMVVEDTDGQKQEEVLKEETVAAAAVAAVALCVVVVVVVVVVVRSHRGKQHVKQDPDSNNMKE